MDEYKNVSRYTKWTMEKKTYASVNFEETLALLKIKYMITFSALFK